MPFQIVDGVRYHYEIEGERPPFLLLHGFTGSTENWTSHIPLFSQHYQTITVDLPGHGLTDAPADPARYRMAQVAADVIALLDTVSEQPAHLLGYSMGGRLALYMAITYPQRFQFVVLESASPGLRTESERAQRRQRDETLADRIERDGIKPFVDYWENIPLFASQKRLPVAARQRLREQRLRNRPEGLANSLRGMGTGAQPSLWNQLSALRLPVLLMAGELDTKFVGIARQLYDLLPEAQIAIVPAVGHTVHLEQPDVFQAIVSNFLKGE